jgi:hypothetical protein
MVLPAPATEVVRDLIAYALGETPGLFEGAGGNRIPMLMAEAANLIANRLSEAGFLPPDEALPDGIVRSSLVYVLVNTPASLLLEIKRSFFDREDYLGSPRYQLACRIIEQMEKQGFRITKAFVTAPPSGRGNH